jgi:putative SOS response-associated peptidase YedK
MCGRVFQIYTEEQLKDRYLPEDADTEISLEPVFNLCPTMDSPVVQLVDGNRHIARMRWQLVPATEPTFSTKLSTINARSESIFESRLYRDLVVRQRCIVPISGFFEWKRDGESKRPFKILLRDEPIMSVAGIWSAWHPGTKDERRSFSILTTSANDTMKEIHERMPVILARSDEDAWLDPDVHEQEELKAIMKPCPAEWLQTVEVSALVNSAKNNMPEILTPATATRPRMLFE